MIFWKRWFVSHVIELNLAKLDRMWRNVLGSSSLHRNLTDVPLFTLLVHYLHYLHCVHCLLLILFTLFAMFSMFTFCPFLRPKKWHFWWHNQNSKTTLIVQKFPKYCRNGFYFMKLSLLSQILAKFQFCWFSGLFWAFFPCKKCKK